MSRNRVCADDGHVFHTPLHPETMANDDIPENTDSLPHVVTHTESGQLEGLDPSSPVRPVQSQQHTPLQNTTGSHARAAITDTGIDNDGALLSHRISAGDHQTEVHDKARTLQSILEGDDCLNLLCSAAEQAANTNAFHGSPNMEAQTSALIPAVADQQPDVNSTTQQPCRSRNRSRSATGRMQLEFDSDSSLSDPEDMPFSQEHPNLNGMINDDIDSDREDESQSDSSHGDQDEEAFMGTGHLLATFHGSNAAQSAMEDVEAAVFAEPLDDDGHVETQQDEEFDDSHVDGLWNNERNSEENHTLAFGESNEQPSGDQQEINETTRRGNRSDGLENWDYSGPFAKITLAVDDVDKELAPRFVNEVQGILRNVESEVWAVDTDSFVIPYRDRFAENETLSRLKALDIFLPRSLLEKVRAVANRALSQRDHELVDVEELRGIVIFHVLCASYRASPTTLSSKHESKCFLQMGITSKRYKQVWSALNGFKGRRSRVQQSGTSWNSSSACANAFIAEIEQDLASINRRLLYVPNATIFSLDDDHLRLSSRAVSLLTNLRQINNPEKALGPVCNAICSALTSVFIAGHYSRPKEQLIDTWVRLVQLVQGAPTQGSLQPMPDAIFAADRGYNCRETITFLSNRLGATALGTHKRSLDFPFVFGEGPIRKRHKGMAVSESGCRAIYSAKQKPLGSSSHRRMEASVYRESYSGRIAAVYTNNERMFGASKFTLVPRDAFRGGVDAVRMRALAVVFQSPTAESSSYEHGQGVNLSGPQIKLNALYDSLIHLTYFQSEDPSWFLLRAFTFTSRTANLFFRATAKSFEKNIETLAWELRGNLMSGVEAMPSEYSEAVNLCRDRWDLVLSCAGMRKDSEDVHIPSSTLKEDILALTRESLEQMRKKDVNKILSDAGRGLSSSMLTRTRRQELIELAIGVREQVASGDLVIEDTTPPTPQELTRLREIQFREALRKASLESWVMKPLVATSGMREGSLNETSVLKALPRFVNQSCSCFKQSGAGQDPFRYAVVEEQGFRIESIQTVGLVCSKSNRMFGDSPDAIFGYTEGNGNSFAAAIEVKTMTSFNTIESSRTIKEQTANIIVIEDIGLINESDERFRKVVPTSAYRMQCLHHAVVLDVGSVTYVVAKGGASITGEVIYVALLNFSDTLKRNYVFCLSGIREYAFSWVGGSAQHIPIDYDELLESSHASDLRSFASYYSLSLALKEAVLQNGDPLPPARMVRPKILVSWNAMKGGVDEHSRALKSYAMVNVSESPLVSVIGRMLANQVANAGRVFQFFVAKETGKFQECIEDVPECERSYVKLRHKVTSCQTSNEFIRRLAEEWIERQHFIPPPNDMDCRGSDPKMTPRFSRNAYLEYNKGINRRLRLSQARDHEMLAAQSAYCSLCGFTFKYRNQPLRSGAKQNKWCSICRQAICVSCWDEWHTKGTLTKLKPSEERINAFKAKIDRKLGPVAGRRRRTGR